MKLRLLILLVTCVAMVAAQDDIIDNCVVDSDCQNEFYKCELKDDVQKCIHKGVFPMYGIEYAGLVLTVVLLIISQMAGNGGGGLMVLIAQIFFGFDVKGSVGISTAVIFAGSTARYLYTWNDKNPKNPDAILPDYNIAIVLLPAVLMGSQIGNMILKLLPAPVISIFLIVVLILIEVQVVSKGIETTQKENKQLNATKDKNNGKNVEEEIKEKPLKEQEPEGVLSEVASESKVKLDINNLESQINEADNNDGHQTNRKEANEPNHEVKSEKDAQEHKEEVKPEVDDHPEWNEKEKKEALHLKWLYGGHLRQWKKLLICFAIFVSIVFLNFSIGSKSRLSIFGWKCGSTWTWVIQAVFVVECALVTAFALRLNICEQKHKIKYHLVADEEFEYNFKNIVKLIIIGVIGGMLAGGLGLGGGVIFNPALLTLGYQPKVANSTGMFLVMISVLSSFLINVVANNVQIDYALWLSAWAIAAAIIGIFVGNQVVKKMGGRQSFLIWMLVVVFVLTIIAAFYSGIAKYQEGVAQDNDMWKFQSLC